MAKKKKNGAGTDLPWFIRSETLVELVWKGDPAIKKGGFPEDYVEVGAAPKALIEFKHGKEPTVFHTRSMGREEQILLYGVMAQSHMEGDSAKQFVFLMDEAAKRCVEKVTLPDGKTFSKAMWEKHYKNMFGTLAACIGQFVIKETHKDPLS